MSTDNVVEFLVLADLFSAPLLKRSAVRFVHCIGRALFETDVWTNLEMSHPHLFQLQFLAESLSPF